MIYLSLVLALGLGYIIGLLQNGVNIHHKGEEVPEEFNKSVGNSDVMKYYEETEGLNKF